MHWIKLNITLFFLYCTYVFQFMFLTYLNLLLVNIVSFICNMIIQYYYIFTLLSYVFKESKWIEFCIYQNICSYFRSSVVLVAVNLCGVNVFRSRIFFIFPVCRCQLQIDTCHLSLQWLNHVLLLLLLFNTLWKEFRVEGKMRHSLLGKKLARQVFR